MASGVKRKRSSIASDTPVVETRRHLLGEVLSKDSAFGRLSEEHQNSESDVTLAVNEGYAKRFEHNKKREELHRCEFDSIETWKD